MGHSVVSTWLVEVDTHIPGSATPLSSASSIIAATRDLREVSQVDLFLVDTHDVTPRGGREVELGWALARGIFTVIVGPRRNVFHHITNLQFDSWEDALEWLQKGLTGCAPN